MHCLMLLLFFSEPVFNPNKPADARSFALKEEVTIGTTEEPLPNGSVAIGGPTGNIYVLIPNAFKVNIYATDGSLKGSFGTKGRGEGQFSGPSMLGRDNEGRILVFDIVLTKMIRFDTEGNYIDDHPMEPQIRSFMQAPAVLADGHMVLNTVRKDQRGQFHYEAALVAPDFSRGPILSSQPLPQRDWRQAGNPNFWADFMRDMGVQQLSGYPSAAVSADQKIIIMEPGEYRGTFFDTMPEETGSFLKEHPTPEMAGEARLKLMRSIWNGMRNNPDLAKYIQPNIQKLAEASFEPTAPVSPVIAAFPLAEGFGVLSRRGSAANAADIDVYNNLGRHLGSAKLEGEAPRFITAVGNRIFTTNLVGRGVTVRVYQLK